MLNLTRSTCAPSKAHLIAVLESLASCLRDIDQPGDALVVELQEHAKCMAEIMRPGSSSLPQPLQEHFGEPHESSRTSPQHPPASIPIHIEELSRRHTTDEISPALSRSTSGLRDTSIALEEALALLPRLRSVTKSLRTRVADLETLHNLAHKRALRASARIYHLSAANTSLEEDLAQIGNEFLLLRVRYEALDGQARPLLEQFGDERDKWLRERLEGFGNEIDGLRWEVEERRKLRDRTLKKWAEAQGLEEA